MFSCKDLTVTVGDNVRILDNARASFKHGKLNAVIGPSGCGKTTLMKAMMGIIPSTGEVEFRGKRIKKSEDLTGQVGFAPQFSIAHPQLSVEESIRFALDLFLSDSGKKKERLDWVLGTIGLDEHRMKRVSSLSGGQLRRLGLGIELTLDPEYMICDEVTSGLDPNSEDYILKLLTRLANERQKTFLCIIHNLAKLDYFDWITVIYEGAVVFQGSLDAMQRFFGIPDALKLYDHLNAQNKAHWLEKWGAYKKERYGSADVDPVEEENKEQNEVEPPAPEIPMLPGAISQFATLLRRRFLMFRRDTGYLILTLAITVGFPVMVVIFALDGLPEMRGLSLSAGVSLNAIERRSELIIELVQTGSLVSGLVMFQVILLTLMGSNNGAREIAAERLIFEKERLSGLNPGSYCLSKAAFVTLVATFQGVYMCLFVKQICEFPGNPLWQCAVLAACCVSMSLVSLGFSGLMASAEKASLLSIYLVGFQLPLSGVVLALPEALRWVCRPFINAFWSWSGYIVTTRDTRYYDGVMKNYTDPSGNPDWLPPDVALPVAVLGIHMVVGVGMALYGCSRKRWD